MSNSTTQTNKSEKLCVVILDFRQWTGTTVLKPSDFKIGENGKLPPKEVIAQLGQKSIIHPQLLDRFATIKGKAVRLLQDNGVSFLGGYAIPLDKAPDVLKVLDDYVVEYEAAKNAFINSYDSLVEEWILQNPDFADELRAAKKSKADVDSRIHASYTAIRVQPLEAENQQSKFNEDIDGLSERLLKTVAQTAGKLSLGTLKGKETSIRPVPAIRRICTKLKGLSFLDPGINPIVEMIEDLLSKVPLDDKISGPLFWETQAVISILADADKMRAIADGTLNLDVWRDNFVPDAVKPKNANNFALVEESAEPQAATPKPTADQSLDEELSRILEERSASASCQAFVPPAAQPQPEFIPQQESFFF